MDKYELRTMALSAGILVIFMVAVLYNAFGRKTDMPACIPFDKTYTRSEVRKIDDHLYQVFIVAHMWSFDSEEIDIPAGSTVDFYLTSKDVVHGFNIIDKGVNLMAVPGSINKITARFEEPGMYRFVCNEFCGIGHQNMMGKIIVK